MATPTLARMSATPTSARAFLKPSTPKPILKRPTPLPLSPNPFPFSASFSIHISPSAKSPHVHFAPSPRLTSTYTTHSPNTYDRAPISVSPNPLALPAWGDRVYSPTLDGFKLADPPKHAPLVLLRYESPRMAEFEDPRSPPPKSQTREDGVRFAELPKKSARDPTELRKALTTYPRSPYPTAPLSPVDFEPASEELAFRERATSRRTLSLDEKKFTRKRRIHSPRIGPTPFTPIPSPLSKPHLSPVEEQLQLHNATAKTSKKPPPLRLESAGDPADPIIINVTSAESTTSSSGGTSTKSARLSQAFWQSMSLIGTESRDLQGLERPVMTSHKYPASIDDEDGCPSSSSSLCPDTDIDVVGSGLPGSNSAQLQFMFATRDGVLWSPGLPRKARPGLTTSSSAANAAANESMCEGSRNLLSPGNKSSFGFSLGLGKEGMKISRSLVASPSPKDPTATFPSFSAALASASDGVVLPEVEVLKYPPRAQVAEQRRARIGNRV